MNSKWEKALTMMETPAWPLSRLVLLIFLTGDFESFQKALAEIEGPIDTGEILYKHPKDVISSHINAIEDAADIIAGKKPLGKTVLTAEGQPCDAFEAALLLAQQEIISKELEEINSLLCGPCSCALCCTGPTDQHEQTYFEIPLAEDEIELFNLDKIENSMTLSSTCSEAEKEWDFLKQGPALYHWANGWSLILPKNSSCPNLSQDNYCKIYANRPNVCKKPQIFSYVVEKQGENLVKQEKLLAILDCPYVKELKDSIGEYGRKCGLEVVLTKNKM